MIFHVMYVEGRALWSASAKAMAKFFWEDLYCQYGAIGQIVTDNGSKVKGEFQKLLQQVDNPQSQPTIHKQMG